MTTQTKEPVAIIYLVQQKAALEERIKRLEDDLKAPLSNDYNEQACEMTDRNLRQELLEIEKKNLRSVNQALDERRASWG